MWSKATLRLIRSLDSRKGRRATGLFVAEGPKLVGELAGAMECEYLLFAATWAAANGDVRAALSRACAATGEDCVADADFARASLLQTPQGVLALFRQPAHDALPSQAMATGLHLALDGVQDPGNLGTIVRLADWFGVHDIWCSPLTADVWNPKAVQASMGGLARVRVHYIDLYAALSQLPTTVASYATALDGQPLWQAPLTAAGVVVMGNEGRGVTPDVARACSHRLLIPSFPAAAPTTESLNVGVVTAIVLAEFRRRLMS